MKKIYSNLFVRTVLTVIAVALTALIAVNPIAHAAQATIDLQTAEPFAILSGTPGITDAGAASVITGNVGLSPAAGSGIGLLCTQVTGTIYAVDATGDSCFTVNGPLLVTAKNDLDTAYTDAASRTPVTIVPDELGGTTLTPGVYASTSTALQISNIGPLVLDAQGDPSAVFIFEGSDEQAGTLTVGPGGTVSLINEASVCNVFWRVYGATIGSTAVFKGNILALTSITVADGANIEGRLLARNGQVTLINDTIIAPVCTTSVTTSVTPSVIPKLPNTGSGSEQNTASLWAIGISSGIIITLLSFIIVQRKRVI